MVIRLAGEAEIDELWPYVGKESAPRWLWHTIDHQMSMVLACVRGRRQDQVFLKLKVWLEAYGNKRYDTDD